MAKIVYGLFLISSTFFVQAESLIRSQFGQFNYYIGSSFKVKERNDESPFGSVGRTIYIASHGLSRCSISDSNYLDKSAKSKELLDYDSDFVLKLTRTVVLKDEIKEIDDFLVREVRGELPIESKTKNHMIWIAHKNKVTLISCVGPENELSSMSKFIEKNRFLE